MTEEENTETRIVPVIEEELVTGTRAVKTGSVRVSKTVKRVSKDVELPAIQDAVQVNRVPINRVVEAIPENREEGDTLIIPVVEEEIIVQKRFILKEEIHVTRQRVQTQVTQTVSLSSEQAKVERLDAEGNVTETSNPVRTEPAPSSPVRPGLLEPNPAVPVHGKRPGLLKNNTVDKLIPDQPATPPRKR